MKLPKIRDMVNRMLALFRLELVKKQPDLYLHSYDSYEQYREVQIHHNKRKIGQVWADEATLRRVGERVVREFAGSGVSGLCHGTRNGFEQNFLADQFGFEMIGTDISETALQFPRSVQWDFHEVNPEWVGRFGFVYTNSLDQSWKPREALSTWLDQLRVGGLLFIEHTRSHGVSGASEMDPFGVKPEYMPYLLCDWFGHRVALEIITATKANREMPVWLFVIRKLDAGKNCLT